MLSLFKEPGCGLCSALPRSKATVAGNFRSPPCTRNAKVKPPPELTARSVNKPPSVPCPRQQARFFINALAEPPDVVADFLVPRIRATVANADGKSKYIRFLTSPKAYSQILAVSTSHRVQSPDVEWECLEKSRCLDNHLGRFWR